MLSTNIFSSNPLPEEQKTTPAGRRRGIASKLLCIRYNWETIKPLLSVQTEFNRGSGIIRGRRDSNDRLMMDHIIGLKGQKLFGTDLRTGTISIWEHQIRYLLSQSENSQERIVAIMGNGNLTQNPYFIAWFGENGLLVRLEHEPVGDREYDCLVIAKNNRVTLETLRFITDEQPHTDVGWQAINTTTNQPLPDTTRVAFSGQRIVKDGQAISRTQLAKQVISGQFYDLRHVFRFPAVSSQGYWRDLALEQFYHNQGVNTDTVSKAFRGEAITTCWRNLTNNEDAVRTALLDKGYQENNQEQPGSFRLVGDHVEINFLDSIYCHNVLGVDKETGKLCSLHITGWSNNVGTTLSGLAQLAANVFQDAILVNNGGDVFCMVNQDQHQQMIPYSKLDDSNWTLVPSCEQRYYIRSALLLVAQACNHNYVEVIKPNFN